MDQTRQKYQTFSSGQMKPNILQAGSQNSYDLNISISSKGQTSNSNRNSQVKLIKRNENIIQLKPYDLDSRPELSNNINKDEIVELKKSSGLSPSRANKKLVFQVVDSDSEATEQIPHIKSLIKEPESQIGKKVEKNLPSREVFNKVEQMDTQIGLAKTQVRSKNQYEKFIMKRNQRGFNKLWNQLDLYYNLNEKYCFSAKLTGYNKEITFTICENKSSFAENAVDYLGKVKTNFMGNIVNIYGPGYNPSGFKKGKLPIRELLATVQYQHELFGEAKPRNFKVYALNLGVSYYEDLEGTTRGSKQVSLNELYKIAANKEKILVMQNKKPEWVEEMKSYVLDFEGRAKKGSVKNFILQDVSRPNYPRVFFGKMDEDEFRLDISTSLAPLVGFGIALSTFGGKIGSL